MKKIKYITKTEAWKLFKKDHPCAHEDWTPEFFLLDFLKEKGLKIKHETV